MLRRVVVESETPLNIPIRGASPRDSIQLYKITGLDTPDTDLFVGDMAGDGGYYTGRRVTKRNPVLTLNLNPNHALGETVSGLREMLYKIFMDPYRSSDNLHLTLYDSEKPDRYFSGYTEKIETDIFSNDTTMVISMICSDPYIYSSSPYTYISEVGSTSLNFPYKGTVEVGLYFEARVEQSTTKIQFQLYDRVMTLNGVFEAGDFLKINTASNQRSIFLNRDDVDYPFLSALDPKSPWLEIHQSPNELNTLHVFGDDPDDIVASITRMQYRTRWWGV